MAAGAYLLRPIASCIFTLVVPCRLLGRSQSVMAEADVEDLASRASQLAARVSNRAGALRDDGDDWAPCDDDDASYFVLKQELLTSYCALLSYYVLRKAKGLSVADHPVLQRLYELRVVFEKLRLLDPKLRHQLDKVLSRADSDAAALRADAAALAASADAAAAAPDAAAGEAGDGVYRAPRHAAARYGGGGGDDDDDDSDGDGAAPPPPREEASGERTQRNTRARRAEIARLVRADADQPELASSGGVHDALGTGKKAAKRDRRRKEMQEQEKFEEDRFMRVDTNKKLKKKRKTTDFASSLDDLL
jgi:U3 small nucleolar ribonucleoprotein protein LCP5